MGERLVGSASNWITGGLVALLGLAALIFASRATDGVAYWAGLGLFVFSVLFCFGLIDKNVGRRH